MRVNKFSYFLTAALQNPTKSSSVQGSGVAVNYSPVATFKRTTEPHGVIADVSSVQLPILRLLLRPGTIWKRIDVAPCAGPEGCTLSDSEPKCPSGSIAVYLP